MFYHKKNDGKILIVFYGKIDDAYKNNGYNTIMGMNGRVKLTIKIEEEALNVTNEITGEFPSPPTRTPSPSAQTAINYLLSKFLWFIEQLYTHFQLLIES